MHFVLHVYDYVGLYQSTNIGLNLQVKVFGGKDP